LENVKRFEQMAGRMFPGLMPAGAPATPTAPAAPATPAAGAAAMPVQQPASLTVTPLGEGGAPAPTNALRPQTAAPVAQTNALQAQTAPGAGSISAMSTDQLRQAEIMFSQSSDPRAKALIGIIQKEIEGRKQPDLVRGYLFAKTPEGGGFKGSLAEWKQLSAAQTKITLPPQEQAFEKGLGDVQTKIVSESYTAAKEAAEILRTNTDARELLDQGMITGAGAEFLVNLNQALKQVGVDFGYADAAANTQAYAANMGNNVGKLIKLFGAGTGLSDEDRKYAQQIAGGRVLEKLSKCTMRTTVV